VACHFGLHVKPNTESLSANTTSAVVTAITTVILVDAYFAIFTRISGCRSYDCSRRSSNCWHVCTAFVQ
jgi:fatty-acid desaturase